MATYLHRHFDIPILDIERCIRESAYEWQENNSITFKIYTELSLPETLILADQMKKEVMNTFSSFLLNRDDYVRLTDIAEKALLYYMKEYSS
ncbi:MAG: hypothetical protein HeimC2_18860 [Candidatus Heimdallarchaeota archaeon LC_2]|nr:MAG: hypothetical protein HeimC2_18860 [Candidatus Heimdallarchaeota archaeon LC_2]